METEFYAGQFLPKPTAVFCWFLGYWSSKNGSRDDDTKGEFVSPAKPFVVGTTGKKILC